MPIVVLQPIRQMSRTLLGVGVNMGIGPFAQRELDEAIGLAVVLGVCRGEPSGRELRSTRPALAASR